MRFLKKLAAVTAVAACCVTMTGPMVAGAAVTVNPGCHDGKHLMGKEVYQGTTTSVTYHTHNGKECVVTTTYKVYVITCECGEVTAGMIQKKTDTDHSLCTNE